jgi:cell division protein ZapE
MRDDSTTPDLPTAAGTPDAEAPAGPIPRYRALRAAGKLQPDPVQELACEKLQSLHHALAGYRPASGRSGWRERFGLGRRRGESPQGLYIYGDVGRGKSLLMDLFFAGAPVAAKRRVHFHAFMLEVHARIHAWRQQAENGGDPIAPLAEAIAEESWLLCFDEFHVANVADAMILGRLFTALFDAGVVVVTTSNAAPQELYLGGLQRERFLPFIDLLLQRLDVLHLAAAKDYRLARMQGMQVLHTPLGPVARDALDAAFAGLTEGAEVAAETLSLQGRTLTVPRAARGVARFDFDALCGQPLGAADYLALAAQFHTLVLDDVPLLTPQRRNETKRLITLVDALYEHRTNLIMSAAAAADELCVAGRHAAEFRRTASRLIEMQAADYIAQPHVSGGGLSE